MASTASDSNPGTANPNPRPPAGSGTVIHWDGERRRRSTCPLCQSRRRKLLLLRLPRRRIFGMRFGGPRLLHCLECDVRYVAPLVTADYAEDSELTEATLKFYLEQGAGIDPMLEPLNLADARPVKRYVEIGCGFGFSLDYARSMLGWQVRGYDPGLPARAGKAALDLPIENVYVDRSNVEPGSADLVYCSEVIEHIAEPDPFVALFASMVAPRGQLLMTTPNAAAIAQTTAREVLLPILSPGYHVVLYSARSLEKLLRRHGFEHIKVDDASHQLRVAASRVSFEGEAHVFTRDRYIEYLAVAVEKHGLDTPLGLGFGARLLKELVNRGDFARAAGIGARLREALHRQYRIDLDTLTPADLPPPGKLPLEKLGKAWPQNLCGIMYSQGHLAMSEGRDEAADRAFQVAQAFGATLRAALNAMNVDDGETAVLAREAEIARFAVLARGNPNEAALAFEALAERVDAADPGEALRHRERARRRLFVDLVTLGHNEAAEEIVGETPAFDADLTTPEGIRAGYSWGMFLLNHKADYSEAAAAFAAVARASRTASSPRPDLFWPGRFHFALANRYLANFELSNAVADELLAAAGGPSPPPADLLARVGELRAPEPAAKAVSAASA